MVYDHTIRNFPIYYIADLTSKDEFCTLSVSLRQLRPVWWRVHNMKSVYSVVVSWGSLGWFEWGMSPIGLGFELSVPIWWHCLRRFRRCGGGRMSLGTTLECIWPFPTKSLLCLLLSRCELLASCSSHHAFCTSLLWWYPSLWNHKPKYILPWDAFVMAFIRATAKKLTHRLKLRRSDWQCSNVLRHPVWLLHQLLR